MPWLETWNGRISGEQINPPEYRWTGDNPADEYNPDNRGDWAEQANRLFQKTTADVIAELEYFEEAAEAQKAHDHAVQLAIEADNKFRRSCRRRRQK